MNDKNLTKKTKKELIELFKEIKEQNNSLHVSINIRQSLVNALTENTKRKDIIISKQEELISKQEELINVKDELIRSQDETIRLKDEAICLKGEAIYKIINYSIILDVCIIVGALLMIFFI